MTEDIRETKKIGPDIHMKNNHALNFSEDQIINSRYRIIKKIGSGGFGVVYKSRDLILKKEVAIKFLDPAILKDKKKFIRVKREINTSQKISDDRIIKIFGIDYINDIPFLVMEYIEGQNLKSAFKDKSFRNWEDFKIVYIEILKGVQSLHDKNIVHRDIKPSNIIITSNGNVKIIDFGLSKELGDMEKTSSIGELIGSPKYMSPEQIRGGNIDQASDIYQLGLILYYFFFPSIKDDHDSSTLEKLMERIKYDPRKIYSFDNSIPKFLKFGILKALESEKKLRFRSVEEMIKLFSSDKLIFLKSFIDFFKRKIKLFSIAGLVLAVIAIIMFVYGRNLQVISGLNIDGSSLRVTNNIGVELFRKDFTPMSVLTALPVKVNSDFKRLRQRIGKKSYLNRKEKLAAVFLNKKNLYKDIINLSLKSEKFSSKVALVNNKGEILYSQKFHLNDDYMKSSLFSGWMDFSDIHTAEITDDSDEIVFTFFQNMSMYPSGICLLNDKDFNIVNNPGHIEKYYIFPMEGKSPEALIVGMSNPFCHLRFVSYIDMETSGLQLPPSLHKNIQRGSPKYLYMLIPHKTEVYRNNWETDGTIVFKSQSDKRFFELNKKWELKITDDRNSRIYKDDDQKISDMLYFLSLAYRKKIEKSNYSDSISDVEQAIKLNLSNPMFKALIYYFAGDLYLSSGKYRDAEHYLGESEKFIKDNCDLGQKRAEMYFLSEKYKKLENELKLHIINKTKFFGINGFGLDLFRIYYYVHSGRFTSADDLSYEYGKATNFVKSLILMVKGDYRESYNYISGLLGNRSTPFTLAEFRLLYSRIILTNFIIGNKIESEELKLAKFYFDDIAVNSLPDGHLAAMSRAYFMLMDGDEKSALTYAKEKFNKLLTDSKGDMFTKLWLFYDAFIYGKLMEKTGNNKEAIKGFEISFNSNPNSDLGLRAKKIIEKISLAK